MTSPFEVDPSTWMFQRDEVDLLEEEIEEIYHVQEHRDPVESAMEREVMKEQMETEERTETELVLTWGAQMLEQGHPHHEEPFDLDLELPLRELLKDQTQRDPLYIQGFLWSRDVFRFAKEHYGSGSDVSEEMFRVYLNATMIPIKLSIGHADASLDDAFSRSVFQKEYELALIYLERTLESLQRLVIKGYALLIPFVSSGLTLRKKLLLALRHLGRPHGPEHSV